MTYWGTTVIRIGALAVIAALLGVSTGEADAAAKPRFGVFGTVNGKRFKARNVGTPTDPCVTGIYSPSQGTLVFAALECKGKRRRQGVAAKRNYKILVMACSNFDTASNPLTPPFEIPCPGSAYSETRTGRFRQPLSTTQWGADFQLFEVGPPTSSVRMRIDEFDGTRVRGAIFGVFTVPLEGDASSVPAPIEGEVQFDFPFQIQ